MSKPSNFTGNSDQYWHRHYQERDWRGWLYSGELYQCIAHMLERHRGKDWWARLHTAETSCQRRTADQCARAHWFVVDMGVSYSCYPLEYSPQFQLNDISSDSTLSDVLEETERQWNLVPQKNQTGNELSDFWGQFSKFRR